MRDGCWRHTNEIHGDSLPVDSDSVELVAMFIDPRFERILFGVGKGGTHFDFHAVTNSLAALRRHAQRTAWTEHT